MPLKSIIGKTMELTEEAKFRAESAYSNAVDGVNDVVDFTSGAFQKTYASVVVTYEVIKITGLTIGLIAAPVPTFIAIGVIWLMEMSVESAKVEIDKQLKDKKKKREFDRVVSMLKKYGKLPKTAIVETEVIKMEIDSITGEIKGEVICGEFKGHNLEGLTAEQISKIQSMSTEKDTYKLLESYLSFRQKMADANTG